MEEVKKQGMESLFVPYEIALALKELGFDEPCLGFYSINNRHFKDGHFHISTENLFSTDIEPIQKQLYCVSAPLFQQAFRWFREKYKLHSRVFFDGLKELEETDEERYNFDIVEQWTIGKVYFDYSYEFKHLHSSRGIYMSYEEAELECLKKLIEIVKSKK